MTQVPRHIGPPLATLLHATEMHSLIKHLKPDKADEEPRQPQSDAPVKRSRAPAKPPSNDPNIPKKRLHVNQICLYERRLPGRAYVSAHVNRLQHGFYRSDVLHGAAINHVYFVSVRFVFHPHDPESHRFRSAEIQVSLYGEDPSSSSNKRAGRSQPRILKHAPELMFGAVSPENLQWNFSLSTSLGVSPASPIGAYIIPQASVQSSYKVYHMMSVQGSVRSRQDGSGHTIEDSKAVWTLSENVLQKSGLPREFDFVMLVQKPKDVRNIYMTVNVDASVATWYGAYPQWYNNLSEYMPSQNFAVSFEHDVGQRFLPNHPGFGYNFADLIHSLDQYVMMPGTIYPTAGTNQGESNPNQTPRQPLEENKVNEPDHAPSRSKQRPRSPNEYQSPMQDSSQRERRNWTPEHIDVRLVVDHRFPRSPDPRRFSYSPPHVVETRRHPSIRRRKSRIRLKEYGEVEFKRTYTR